MLDAISLYAAAYLIASGIEMIATRALDSRGIFMVGLSLCAGLATMLMPGLSQGLPEGVAMLAGDGFVVTGVCVMGLTSFSVVPPGHPLARQLRAGPRPGRGSGFDQPPAHRFCRAQRRHLRRPHGHQTSGAAPWGTATGRH